MKTYTTKANANRAAKTLSAKHDIIVEAVVVPFASGYSLEILLVAGTEEIPADLAKFDTHCEEPKMNADEQAYFDINGFIDCPECGIHYSNGIDCEQVEEDGMLKSRYTCLGSGCTWDRDIIKIEKVILRKSTVGKPCNLTWDIADSMPGARRKDVLEARVAEGIAYYTARTQ